MQHLIMQDLVHFCGLSTLIAHYGVGAALSQDAWKMFTLADWRALVYSWV